MEVTYEGGFGSGHKRIVRTMDLRLGAHDVMEIWEGCLRWAKWEYPQLGGGFAASMPY